MKTFLPSLKQAGLTGMEVYYKAYTPEQVEELRRTAKQHDLMPLGGSDYHGLGNADDREIGDIPLPEEPIRNFLDLGEDILARRAAGRGNRAQRS